ncbi:phycobiliprotein lyase [Allocoleopsis sp.]|uniref:phycobiliprotein lyase n=1 Tax=Allocoleopsis sp. TaxID=3088169 RepID=UPI002FD0E9D4
MDIKEFFEQSAGKWFSQRTGHHPAFKQAESGQSNITIEILAADAPEVVQLCQQYHIEPRLAVCGARVTWDGTMEWYEDKGKRSGSTVLVPVPNPDKANEGQLLRKMADAQKAPVTGRYVIGNDDALTMITEYETMYSEERLWFASPNFRLRTTILKHSGGFSMASLYSEIRMGVSQPPKKAEDAAAKA